MMVHITKWPLAEERLPPESQTNVVGKAAEDCRPLLSLDVFLPQVFACCLGVSVLSTGKVVISFSGKRWFIDGLCKAVGSLQRNAAVHGGPGEEQRLCWPGSAGLARIRRQSSPGTQPVRRALIEGREESCRSSRVEKGSGMGSLDVFRNSKRAS